MKRALTPLKAVRLSAALEFAADSCSPAASADSDMIAAGSPMSGVVDADYKPSTDSVR